MVPFPMILSDSYSRFKNHGVTINALNVLCAQLTRDLFAIAKFLSESSRRVDIKIWLSFNAATYRFRDIRR